MATAKAAKPRGKAAARAAHSAERPRLATRLRRAAIALFLVTALPVLMLRWVPPPLSMFMLIDQAGAFLSGDWHYRVRYQWTPWREIAMPAKLAVVAAEDQNFARHFGFDFKAMGKAFEKNLTSQKLRGGSTITQQTAKNLFLYPGRSYLRKALEAYFTTLIELSWPKQRILEVYLNIAEFGEGVYGVGAAGQHFFGKPAARLTVQDAARLAAVLPNPKLLRAGQPSAYVLKRQAWIAGQMRHLSGQHVLDEL